MSSSDEKNLSSPAFRHTFFGDCFLTFEDVNLLRGPYWLNDQIISFHFLYLKNRRFANRDDILFMDPSCAFLVASTPSEFAKDALQPLKLKQKNLVFVPINDNENVNSAGGSHWGLLMYDRSKDKFTYYDSMGSSNLRHGKHMATQLAPFLTNTGKVTKFEHVQNVPRQVNSYDCGVYMLAYATALSEGSDLKEITPQRVTELRKQILRSIEDELRKDTATAGSK